MWTFLGQNFLIDAKVRSYIADKISALYKVCWCEALIEIWPGKGSITTLISHVSENFFVIEKDSTFIENWKLKIENWKFVLGDVLEVDVDKLLQGKKLKTKKTLVVGNLPYYITSPILRKFFWNGFQNYAGGIFMVQDEVAQKLKSDAKKKSYLRRLLNYAYTVTYLKWVPGKCFKPIPKVKSALIQLTIKNYELSIERDKLIEFLELFAPFSRKTLGAIATMLQKHWGRLRKVEEYWGNLRKIEEGWGKLRKVEKGWGKLRKVSSWFSIPEGLKKKRLEELSWEDLTIILSL